MLRKDQLEPANQLSLVTTYGLTPVLAAIVFARAHHRRRRASCGRHPRRRPGRPRAVPQRADVPGRRGRHLEPARRSAAGAPPGRSSRRRRFFGSLKHGFSFAGHTPLVRGLVVGITGAFAAGRRDHRDRAGVRRARSAAATPPTACCSAPSSSASAWASRSARASPATWPGERIFGVAIVGAGAMVLLMSLDVHALDRAAARRLHGLLRRHRLPGRLHPARHRGRGRDPRPHVRDRAVAGAGGADPVAGHRPVRGRPASASTTRPRRRRRSRSTGERVMLFVAGLLAIGVGVLAYRQMDDGRPVPLLADVVTALRRDTTARRRLAGGGVFIAFEGGEGAGKSTQVRRLQEWLTSEGLVARATFEPGATAVRRRDPRRSCSTARTPAIAAALGGAAVRRRPRPARARRPAPGARRGRGRHHRPVRRQLAGLPGRGPHDPDRRRPHAVALGDRGPASPT